MRLKTQIAFLMIEVDDFKSVNTRFGPQARIGMRACEIEGYRMG